MPLPMRVLTKRQRVDLIRSLLVEYYIPSRRALSQAMGVLGVDVTHTTVARDCTDAGVTTVKFVAGADPYLTYPNALNPKYLLWWLYARVGSTYHQGLRSMCDRDWLAKANRLSRLRGVAAAGDPQAGELVAELEAEFRAAGEEWWV